MVIYHIGKEKVPSAWTVADLAETGGDPAQADMDPPGPASRFCRPRFNQKNQFCKQISVILATFPVHSSFDSQNAGRMTQTDQHESSRGQTGAEICTPIQLDHCIRILSRVDGSVS